MFHATFKSISGKNKKKVGDKVRKYCFFFVNRAEIEIYEIDYFETSTTEMFVCFDFYKPSNFPPRLLSKV